MSKFAFTILPLFAATLLASACASSELTFAEFTDEYCDRAATCCSEAGPKDDGKQCRALFTFVAQFGGAESFDPKKARACLDGLDAIIEKESAWCKESQVSVSACDGLFGESDDPQSGGSKPAGEDCSFSSECSGKGAAGALCDYSGTVAKCLVYDVATAGSACDADLDDGTVLIRTGAVYSGESPEIPERPSLCDNKAGLTCDSATSVCTPFAEVGDDCSSIACADTAQCSYSAKKCEVLGGPGASCMDTRCADSAYCDSKDQQCYAKKAVGEECSLGQQECEEFCEDGVCATNGGSGGGSFGLCASP